MPSIISDFPGLPIEYFRRDLRLYWKSTWQNLVESSVLFAESVIDYWSPVNLFIMHWYIDFFIDRANPSSPQNTATFQLYKKQDRQIACFLAVCLWQAGFWFFLWLKISVRLIVLYIERMEKIEEEKRVERERRRGTQNGKGLVSETNDVCENKEKRD